MSNFLESLIGLPYITGRQDCYNIGRRYYRHFGIHLPNLARPDNFWEAVDLYGLYARFGFKPVIDEKVRVGDAVLMPIFTPVNSHVGIICGDNEMLHHFPGQLSVIEPYHSKWSRRVTIVLRHPAVKFEQPVVNVQLHEVIDAAVLRNPQVQEAIARAMAAEH